MNYFLALLFIIYKCNSSLLCFVAAKHQLGCEVPGGLSLALEQGGSGFWYYERGGLDANDIPKGTQ